MVADETRHVTAGARARERSRKDAKTQRARDRETVPLALTRMTPIAVPADAWIGQRLQADRIPLLRQTELFRQFTGEHDTALPFNRAIRSLLVLNGPAVRAGRRRVPVRMVDVAPTICHYLKIPFPAQCEGGVLADALSGDA